MRVLKKGKTVFFKWELLKTSVFEKFSLDITCEAATERIDEKERCSLSESAPYRMRYEVKKWK